MNIMILSFLMMISVLSMVIPSRSSSSPMEAYLYGGCSQLKYAPTSSYYESNLNSLLTSLVNSATYSSYNKFTVMGPTQSDVVYGLYQCRGDLAMPDCATCVARAVTQVTRLCPTTCGGALQFQGCYVKYDNSTFLGDEDKSVVLKKCGPSTGYDTDAMGQRDAVLAGMANGGAGSGMYRAGGSGNVQGLGQCVGDLSMGQCQDCLAEATRRLKTDCGTAVYGDMFLGKCYVRYSTKGAHEGYAKANAGSNSHDGGGTKTFAIIIGLLAGIALLIIFLTFMRNICGGGHGK
ncbi:plasmodesmata-located protein 7 [Impatiens glandulifera]|uniref:plasmodesmata-located protein 7 n=1 Tax=Impatiens glandulifera TaxID=253017 RepID=UPI001FB0E26A|nr:plasmodesmata-located protein 7 [Impatiens glandulifera]